MDADFTSLELPPQAVSRLADVLRIGGVLPGELSEREADLLAPNWPNPARAFDGYRAMMLQRGPCSFMRAWRDETNVVTTEALDAKGRVIIVRVGFDERNRVRLLTFSLPLPEGVTIRPAVPNEFPALAELERAAPMQMGEGISYRTFRPNFADLIALQPGGKLWAAWRGERAIALRGHAFKMIIVNDAPQLVVLSQFAIVHPDERGANLLQCFGRYEGEQVRPIASHFIAHIDEGNVAAMKTFGGTAGGRLNWRRRVKMLLFACAPGPETGCRAATPADAARLATLMNEAHGTKVLYMPQTAESVIEKLSRTAAYGFADMLMTERAFVGVWLSGEEIEDTRTGVVHRRKLATVVDYGFSGAQGVGELSHLIETQCARAAATGHSHLVLYLGDEALEFPTLRARATLVDSFILRTSVPEPPAGTPVYPDALFI